MPNAQPYYVDLDMGCDAIVRCESVLCSKLVLSSAVAQHGGCPRCGNRRVGEVRALSLWEWLKVRTGFIQFPHREKFLKEFDVPFRASRSTPLGRSGPDKDPR